MPKTDVAFETASVLPVERNITCCSDLNLGEIPFLLD